LQIFDTSCALRGQGWSFSMQASMLEIYNEEYKDLLAHKSGGGAGASRSAFSVTGNGGGGGGDKKQHQVLHNMDGSTTVTDLTCVDVTSSDKVRLETLPEFQLGKLSSQLLSKRLSAQMINDRHPWKARCKLRPS
jgi:hypothetical protein